MKVRAKLMNHGYIEGVLREGGEVVEIDDKDFNSTWMQKVAEVPNPPKRGGLIKRILGG